MDFIADKQTLEDLNLVGKFRPQSIYNLFNKVQTTEGEKLLEAMFARPLTDAAVINERSRTFQFFQRKAFRFPLDPALFHAAVQYLSMGTHHSFPAVWADLARKKVVAGLLRNEQWQQLQEGAAAVIRMLQVLKKFMATLDVPDTEPYFKTFMAFNALLADRRLEPVWTAATDRAFSVWALSRYDHLLRHTLREEMEQLVAQVGRLDVYIAVSGVAAAKGFHYAHALPAAAQVFFTTGLRHPALDKGVANALTLSASSNLLFLTGANMAGKSTLMKSFGIAVYLGHMGFPVAAEQMEFSVRDGLYSSINVPDNLSLGYSHFYAEVLRVKTVAQAVSEGKNLVVIFDELFKGTNVKDAHDATLAVTAAFTAYRNCCFIISTHIIEVGEPLKQQVTGVQFAFLPTVMEGPLPRYTYRLTGGITNDRHGMMIIHNEGILEMI
ncbi:DNA mismatch repair protein [Chitinophaga parva]|uniref:DNA mismatch repair protein n=1 Tax=Chitinophaga parva TaxID=2169414 RepID=A0A2T7BHM8_9BACT|nr:DNA mismatch repair protein [Chitinophaga parva]PUZ25780.1 DNA mismatch repair protein [Chitinophaga parva]